LERSFQIIFAVKDIISFDDDLLASRRVDGDPIWSISVGVVG
jgi:hypothetical protein